MNDGMIFMAPTTNGDYIPKFLMNFPVITYTSLENCVYLPKLSERLLF